MKTIKPLEISAYGSIPHLQGSKMDASEKRVTEGQERILTEKARDYKDIIITQEKVDGSCVAITLVDGKLIALGRSGYPAYSSPYTQHRMFANWVARNADRFKAIIHEGDRLVGEWMVQAHGTLYDLTHEPFIVFDYFLGQHERMCYLNFLKDKVYRADLTPAKLISYGHSISKEEAMKRAKVSGHGAIDPVEGVVWRVEREGKVDFLAKYVRPDKVDGKYLFGNKEVWNTVNGKNYP